MFHRLLNPILSNSFLLFGARGVGKSTVLKELFKNKRALWFDLLDLGVEDELKRTPNSFFQQVQNQKDKIEWVVVDEIQKIPELLNSVHKLIEATSVKFALTGSSARKLKRGQANLLAGRAFVNYLHPFTHVEMTTDFDLNNALHFGTLPKISHLKTFAEKEAYLQTYAQVYLKEEIWAEHIIRKLDPFRKFLEIAAQTNTEILNYTNIAKDIGADVKTVQSYYQILEDTLIGFFLEPYHKSIRKQQRQNPKFYFFDTGIKRALDRTLAQTLLPNTYGYGKAFEHFLITEIFRLNSYFKKNFRFYYLKTKDQAEIDLIIDRPGLPDVLIEIKSSTHVDERDTKTLERFLKDFPKASAYVLSNDPTEKKIGSIVALPWQKGLEEIGLA